VEKLLLVELRRMLLLLDPPRKGVIASHSRNFAQSLAIVTVGCKPRTCPRPPAALSGSEYRLTIQQISFLKQLMWSIAAFLLQ